MKKVKKIVAVTAFVFCVTGCGLALAAPKEITLDNLCFEHTILLDPLPADYRIKFVVGSVTPTLTKTQLVQAIEMFQAKRVQSMTQCTLGPNGEVLNYPCRVSRGIVKK